MSDLNNQIQRMKETSSDHANSNPGDNLTARLNSLQNLYESIEHKLASLNEQVANLVE